MSPYGVLSKIICNYMDFGEKDQGTNRCTGLVIFSKIFFIGIIQLAGMIIFKNFVLTYLAYP